MKPTPSQVHPAETHKRSFPGPEMQRLAQRLESIASWDILWNLEPEKRKQRLDLAVHEVGLAYDYLRRCQLAWETEDQEAKQLQGLDVS